MFRPTAKFLSLSLIACLTLAAGQAFAKTLATTVYGRTADLTILETLGQQENLSEMVKAMESVRVRIYKVPGSSDAKAIRYFSFLLEAPVGEFPDLLDKVSDVGPQSALFSTQSEIHGAKTNVILIADDALPMTVLHEFSHHLFESQNHQQTAELSKAQAEGNAVLTRFNFKTRKVMLDNSLLVSKQWRDEIKSIAEEYAATVNSGQGQIASEEIVVETALLRTLVDTKSKYLNLKRANEGINGYAQGLAIRSNSLIENIYALDDLIVTEGFNQDPETSDEERKDWQQRRSKMEKSLHDYQQGPLKQMKAQVEAAQILLKTIKAQM